MTDIFASDLNTIRTKIIDVLGPGSQTFGYGQTVYSASVNAGQLIRKIDWDAVRYDIINTYIHQTGNDPSTIVVSTLDTINDDASGAYQNYDYYADVLRNNRFDIATGQYVLAAIDSKSTSSSWNTTASAELTVTFDSATEARYFFNSGGAIRMNSSMTGGTTQQTNAWSSLLLAVGDQDFVGDLIAANGFYSLTNTYQTYYSRASSTPYSANTYRLRAKCDVVDNSAGTATVIDFKVELVDSYVDPDDAFPAANPQTPPVDLVDGTLTITATELKATGVLQPTGDPFTVNSPISYSMSAISLS